MNRREAMCGILKVLGIDPDKRNVCRLELTLDWGAAPPIKVVIHEYPDEASLERLEPVLKTFELVPVEEEVDEPSSSRGDYKCSRCGGIVEATVDGDAMGIYLPLGWTLDSNDNLFCPRCREGCHEPT